jgi:hypothetical protein
MPRIARALSSRRIRLWMRPMIKTQIMRTAGQNARIAPSIDRYLAAGDWRANT